MPESGPLGSVRGDRGNPVPYRDTLDHASKLVDVAKTRDGSIPWDKPVGDLIIGRTATGVEGA